MALELGFQPYQGSHANKRHSWLAMEATSSNIDEVWLGALRCLHTLEEQVPAPLILGRLARRPFTKHDRNIHIIIKLKSERFFVFVIKNDK